MERPAGKKSAPRRLLGSALSIVGFLLSPLSWWNDLVVNVPLALAFAWVLSLFFPSAFLALAVLGYWLTNVLGLILMHKGAHLALAKGEPPVYTWKVLLRDLAVSLAYTLVIVLLIELKWIEPPAVLFGRSGR